MAGSCERFVWIDVDGYDSARQALKHKISNITILHFPANDDLIFRSEYDARHSQQVLINPDHHAPYCRLRNW